MVSIETAAPPAPAPARSAGLIRARKLTAAVVVAVVVATVAGWLIMIAVSAGQDRSAGSPGCPHVARRSPPCR